MRIFQILRPSSLVQTPIPENIDSESNHSAASECDLLLPSTGTSNPGIEELEAPIMAEGLSREERELRVELPPPKPDIYAPPPYEEVEARPSAPTQATLQIEDAAFEQSTAVQPPTYEEVQRQKALEAGEDPLQINENRGNGMQVVRISPMGGLDHQTAEIAEEQVLGTDLMFFVAFTAAFLFNLVGIVLLLCLCHTVAGRTGALAGFGLSMAKWVVIFRHSTDIVADNNSWLLWLIMVLGLLICVRAILQYVSAKREWQQLPHSSRQRFFVFY